MAQENRDQIDRVARALSRAHDAGNTEDARALTRELRRLQSAAPQQVTVSMPTGEGETPAEGGEAQAPQSLRTGEVFENNPEPGTNPFWNDEDERGRVSQPTQLRDYSYLEELGVDPNEQPRARELFDAVREAQAAEDPDAERMATIRLTGYLDGQDAIDGQRGQESAAEGVASRAETAVRGFGQGAFGLGDFSAALGSWLGEGGPVGDFSLREHFAFQRNRREGMAQQNRGVATAGYLAGAMGGGGAIASAATRAGSRLPGAVGRGVQNTFGRTAGAPGQIRRAAAGGAASSGTAAALEGGDAGDVAGATALGAVAGPVGERVLNSGASLVRGAMRRVNPEAAADAAIRRRMLPGEAGFGTAGARELNRRTAELGEGGTIIQAATPGQAAQLGDEASQSQAAMDFVTRRVPEIEEAGAPRMERAVQGDTPITAVRDAERVGEGLLENSTRRLQLRLAQTADTGAENVTPEAIEAIRKQYADEAMGEIGEQTASVPGAGNILARDAVRRGINQYAESADPDEAAILRDMLNMEVPRDGQVELTLRQIDSFRRAFDDMGTENAAMRQGLRDVSDMLSAAAERNPAYAQYLQTYSRLSRSAEGARMGGRARNASLTDIDDFIRLQREGEGVAEGARGAAEVGLNRRAQRAVAEEARRSPRRARQEAQRIREEPERFDTILGPRAGATRRAAEESLGEVERVERGTRALGGATTILDEGGTIDFQRALEEARDGGLGQQFSDVAQTRIASAAGESGQGAFDVANRLSSSPGLRRRVRATLGPDAYDALIGTARRERRAGDALVNFRSGAARNLGDVSKKEKQAIISAIDLGVMATDRWSGSFGANAFLRVMRLLNGDEQRALALARALAEGDRATQRRTMARLAQLGASFEDQEMFARAAGAASGIMTGQAVAEDVGDE